MLSIRLPKDIENRLDALATITNRTKTFYVRKAILELIEDMEDTYLALERLADNNETISHEEVMRDCGLDN